MAGQGKPCPAFLLSDFTAVGLDVWLPRKDSNLNKEIQNLSCYRYTTRQDNVLNASYLRAALT
jgi:hypothetical protein